MVSRNSGQRDSVGHNTKELDCKFLKGILAGRGIDEASRSLKAMAHPLRLKILCVLGPEEKSVQDIIDSVGTTQSNVSQHLNLLKDKGVVASRKDANRVYYSIKNETVQKILWESNT